jgi:GAF domain-containing protein
MADSDLKSRTVDALADLLDALRTDTDAGRTTVRLGDCGVGFHVDTVAAESLAEGVHSILTLNTLDQKNAVAVKWLEKHRRTFVMNDTLDPWDPEVAPEREVVEAYGIRSEMVAPVMKDGDLVGWVSVHYTRGPRVWTDAEIARIEAACESVREVLEGVDVALAAGG